MTETEMIAELKSYIRFLQGELTKAHADATEVLKAKDKEVMELKRQLRTLKDRLDHEYERRPQVLGRPFGTNE